MTKDEALRKIRALCKHFDGVTERPSHGSPTFFIGEKKSFLSVADNHHGDGRLGAWCAAAPGAQAMLVEANPDVYFVPAYVGHLGWVGVRLDKGAPWEEIAAVIEAAYDARKGTSSAKATSGKPKSAPMPMPTSSSEAKSQSTSRTKAKAPSTSKANAKSQPTSKSNATAAKAPSKSKSKAKSPATSRAKSKSKTSPSKSKSKATSMSMSMSMSKAKR